MSNTADFTQGSILKKLCRFMLPVLGALILQAAYGAVDLLVVGRFGSTSGLSAVSTGSQVLNLVTFVVTQLAMGVTVLIARYIGEKREKEIGAVLGGAAVVFTILAGCLFVLLVLFARPISVLMQAPQEALALTASYVRICGCGILFIVAYNVLSAVFRGLGDSRSPLLFVLVACLVNVAGDLVLVAGLHLDAAGAALATVLAQAFVREGLKNVAAGANPMVMRRGISKAVNAAVEHISVPAGQAQAEGVIGCFGGQGILLLVAHLFASHGDGFQRPQHPHLVVGGDLGGVIRVQFSQLRVHGGGTVGLGLLAQLLPQGRGGVLRFKRYTF